MTPPLPRYTHVVGPRNTGGPNSLHERGRDSCLRAVLCYKRLFTKLVWDRSVFLKRDKKCYVFK